MFKLPPGRRKYYSSFYCRKEIPATWQHYLRRAVSPTVLDNECQRPDNPNDEVDSKGFICSNTYEKHHMLRQGARAVWAWCLLS